MGDGNVCIYILKLEQGKYYIGKSECKTVKGVEGRINQHFNQTEKASAWCRKYKPVETIEIKENQIVEDEDKWTKVYMRKYGIENVRGGKYVRVKLPERDISALTAEIDANEGRCYKCKETGHIGQYCPGKKEEEEVEAEEEVEFEEIIVWKCRDCGKEYDIEDDVINCRKIHKQVLFNLRQSYNFERLSRIEYILKKNRYHGGMARKELRETCI